MGTGTMTVDIWSDVVCPWCFVGKRRFEAALASFAHRDEVEVRWRSFQLDPAAPAERTGSYLDRIARKYGVPLEVAAERVQGLVDTAAEEGLELRFDRMRAGNTGDAHRLLHHAATVGLQGALKERLLLATFTEGEPIGDHDTLVRLATEVGLDEAEARRVLEDGSYRAEATEDQQTANDLGASGVPFFVFDGRFGVSGAQATPYFERVLRNAWREGGHDAPAPADAVSCEGDACEV